jgi:hypothetical protein
VRARSEWLGCAAVALVCTAYLNGRSQLVPKWGQWYAGDYAPYTLLQIRAFLSGHIALVPHPWVSERDYFWGRGGMHTAWGLGVPLLATPFHVVGRLFGAPGFPDAARFLVLYAATTFVLARELHRTSRNEAGSLASSVATAGFVMAFPTFVGLLASRFLIYDQTEAVGALWDVALLAGVLALLHRATPVRLAALCAAAGFTAMIRVHLAVYGFTTAVLALVIAHRKGVRARALVAGAATYAGFFALYFAGNVVRFGGPFNTGYENCVCGPLANRMTRWGLPFSKVPFLAAAKEMFATLFLLDPITQVDGPPPEAVKPYALVERFREYYAPTFDLVIFGAWVAALGVVVHGLSRRRLWRSDADLTTEVAVVVGAWSIPPALVLFVFFARLPFTVTRYATDIYPAMAAGCVCTGMALVDVVRRKAPSLTGSAQLCIAGLTALYIAGWRDGPTHLSASIDAKTVSAQIADSDARSTATADLPSRLKCNEDRRRPPVHMHAWGWGPDCHLASGTNIAIVHSPCLTFTFGGPWGQAEQESLAGFRVNGDFDKLRQCGAPVTVGETKRVTMCDPHPPPFLLDGMRLYTLGTLDDHLATIDRLKLLSIDPAPACSP